jgi:tRNA(His) 5'-end guanylyltransferase
MPLRDDLGTRMKEFYETIPKTRLMRRCPVAIRIDGKAFHTFTRGFNKPFDEVLVKSMQNTMKYLCENIQGCVFGYTQSDEITLILLDYQTLDTDAWFDYEVQKMCSIAASMATMAFNRYFDEEVDEYCKEKYINSCGLRDVLSVYSIPELKKVDSALVAYLNSMNKGAMFDARCFNIPKEEVTNLVYWRQLDAARNSVQMVGQANFSHSELQGKSCNMIQDILMTQKGINWNNFPTYLKRGSCCVRDLGGVAGWSIDLDMPMLKGDDRKYLDELIYIGE